MYELHEYVLQLLLEDDTFKLPDVQKQIVKDQEEGYLEKLWPRIDPEKSRMGQVMNLFEMLQFIQMAFESTIQRDIVFSHKERNGKSNKKSNGPVGESGFSGALGTEGK